MANEHHHHHFIEHDTGKNAPTPERPIVGVRQFPLLQTPYLAAVASDSPTSETDIEEGGLKEKMQRPREGRRKSLEIPLPDGWKYFIHPKGWVYYFNPTLRLVTDYRMEYRLGQQEFEHALQQVEGYPVSRLPRNCEMWIDYKLENGSQVPEKLFVDHEKRRLTPGAPPRRKGTSYDEGTTWQDEEIDVWQQLLYEQAYWEYIIGHPCHAPLDKYAEEDAIASLAWFSQDRLLHPEDSLVPYSTQLSKELLDLLTTMSGKEAFNGSRNGNIKTHLVASILERVAGERLRQHYGQEDARNFLKKSFKMRYKDFNEPHPFGVNIILSFIMTVLCLGAPYAYLRHINEFFMSGVGRTDTITDRWQSFVDENVTDWTNTNLVSTVLVSASVALLAIPGIDGATRVLGITSTLFSIASIIIGLLNVWQHQHKSRSDMELRVIFDFFEKAEGQLKTDKFLAILLSLPMVFLIWSTIIFATSMVTFAWRGVDPTFIDSSSGGNGSGGGGAGDIDGSAFQFGTVTSAISTGFFGFLTAMVLNSVLYFWRAWRTTSRRRKEKLREEIQKKARRLAFRF